MNERIRWVAAAALLLLAACDRDATAPAPGEDAEAWDDALADRAWLVETLPDTTWAYLRIPNPLGVMTAPKGGALSTALGSEANRRAVAELQRRLPDFLSAELGATAAPVELLLESLRSPLEIALVGEGEMPMEADLHIAGRFDFASLEDLNAAIAATAATTPALQLVAEASDEAPGQLVLGMVPLFFEMDLATGRVHMVTGMNADPADIRAAAEWPRDGTPALARAEGRIDADRRGLFAWVDMQRLAPVIEFNAPEGDRAQIRALGVLDTTELALGIGSTSGHGRLALRASGDGGLVWDLALPTSPPPAFETSGAPELVAGAVLPDWTWLQRVAGSVKGDEGGAGLAEFDERMVEATGVRLSMIIDTLAGRWTLVEDANGGMLVHEGGGPERWRALFDALDRELEVRQEGFEVEGRRVHHVVLPGADFDEANPVALEEAPIRLLSRIAGAESHVYWMAEDERVLFAAVPQVLMDRAAHPGDVGVVDWLAGAGVDPVTAALYLAASVEHAPRRNYYAYLGVLRMLADLVDAELDLETFPTARSLGLPESGKVGFSIEYADATLGMAIAFEDHPGDLLRGGGGMVAVAGLGILAAVAIPAYQDYVLRAEVAAALAGAAPARVWLAEWVAEHGRLPTSEEAEQADVPLHGLGDAVLHFEAETGALVLAFAPNGLGDAPRLRLVPGIEGEVITDWSCRASGIDDRHLPAECRAD